MLIGAEYGFVSLSDDVIVFVQTRRHIPPEHVWLDPHVCTGVSETRSGPHCTTLVALALHTSCPGAALAQSRSMDWHVPWFEPTALSQSCPEPHVWLYVQTPPLQMSVTFCALPLHASDPAPEHGQPSVPTAPVPLGAHASCPASPASGLPSPAASPGAS